MRVYKHVIEPWPNGRESRDATIYALARRLLSDGAIDPEDRLETWTAGESGTLCMWGNAGELAKWTVRENSKGDPSLQLIRFVPMPDNAKAALAVRQARQAVNVTPRTAKTPLAGITLAKSFPQESGAHNG